MPPLGDETPDPASGRKMRWSAYPSGLATGLFLQLAVGPVFFFIVSICLSSDFRSGLSAIAAVTLADFIYIALSLAGLAAVLEKGRLKRVFGVVGAFALLGFGIFALLGGILPQPSHSSAAPAAWSAFSAFSGAFLLTISSPLTIVFWTSVFAAKANEKDYEKKELALFGIGAGSATFVFLSIALVSISFFKARIPPFAIRFLNIGVGCALVAYSGLRFFKTFRPGGRGR